MVPYEELPADQKMKDAIFVSIVHGMFNTCEPSVVYTALENLYAAGTWYTSNMPTVKEKALWNDAKEALIRS